MILPYMHTHLEQKMRIKSRGSISKLDEEKDEQIVFSKRVSGKTITNFLEIGDTEIIPKT